MVAQETPRSPDRIQDGFTVVPEVLSEYSYNGT